jgi:hypothetical protein
MEQLELHREAEWKKKMITALTIVAIIMGLWALYNYVIMPNVDTSGEPAAYVTGPRADNSIDNTPGDNPASVVDAPPEFTSPHLPGYACIRCSDTGDGDKVQDPLDARVEYTCSPSAMTWDRGGENTRLMFEVRDKAFGNYGSYYPLPDNIADPLGFCAQKCEESKNTPSFGTCRAATFDKNKNVCRFFYACEKVVKSADSDTILIDFDIRSQPEVIHR